MAPLPTANHPGFPFYIPGVAGHRPPKPPLDTRFDGGLPRHVVTDGTASFPMPLDTKDFHKEDVTLAVNWLPEAGTPLEQNAMAFHEASGYTTPLADQWTSTGLFHTNGLPRQPGAPYADPCGVRGQPRGVRDSIFGAAFQLDSIFYNKAKWTFRQHRMFGLWDDVDDFLNMTKAPEPLFFRVHDNTCLTYHLVNLIPEEYEQDDFQVQTPTDVVGQHIHLVKFDVTSSDGAANGWNYEDGSLSPGDVQHRIAAIRAFYNCGTTINPPNCPGPAQPHPFFGAGPNGAWLGAQETVQRWWVDPVLRGGNRTSPLGTVFTHDHFGPSTHQQAGLYAAMIPEETGTVVARSGDGDARSATASTAGPPAGGPTSSSRRTRRSRSASSTCRSRTSPWRTGRKAGGGASIGRLPPINPPGKDEVGLPNLLRPPFARNGGPPGLCPNGIDLPPCPEILSADDPGIMTVNYRNEPLALRVRTTTNVQATGAGGDLSFSFSSQRDRADNRFDTYGPYGSRPGELSRDPFTPLMRLYEDDRVKVNLLVGAHEEGHNVNIRGTRWLFEPLDYNSGWRNSQMAAISEYHNFKLTPLIGNPHDRRSDFLYESAATDDRWTGGWGIMRMYRTRQRNLCRVQETSCGNGMIGDVEGTSFSASSATLDGSATGSGSTGGSTGGSTDSGIPDAEADARKIAQEDTGEPVALSLTAAQEDAAVVGDEATVDGYGRIDAKTRFPDPADSTSWRGDLATLESAEARDPQYVVEPVPVEGGAMAVAGTSSWTAQDSVDGGYGNQPVGGFDYDQFDYNPKTKTETVTLLTGTPPTGFGLTSAGTLAYVTEPDGTPPEYAMAGPKWSGSGPHRGFQGVCPRIAPVRYYDVTAIDAKTQLPGGRLVYNSRGANGGPLVDTSAVLYVLTSDLKRGLLTPQPDPLVLRARAGECIMVRLRNKLNTPLLDPNGWNTLPPIVDLFNSNQVRPSTRVGLHPQLVAYDVQYSDGSEVGINDDSTVPVGDWRWFTWYAGDVRTVSNTLFRATPIEFGATNLMSSDPIEHASKGAIGALVIEPRRSVWHLDPGSKTRATVVAPDTTFRELVLLWQDDLNLQFGSATTLRRFDCSTAEPMTDEEEAVCQSTGGAGTVTFARGAPVPNLAEAEDPEDSGQKAFNYRTEPLWLRMGFAPNAELGFTKTRNFRTSLTDAQVGNQRPQTPILEARPGAAVRFRLLEPGGHARNHVFNLHGHIWEEEPYAGRSQRLGTNPFSEWKGARDGHGPGNHHDILLRNGAGGKFNRIGEYLFRDQSSFSFDGGLWGILNVTQNISSGIFSGSSSSQPAQPSCSVDANTGQTVCLEQ